MKILLSIKPEFAEEIIRGTKLYEYRKKIFKRNEITKVVVYVSAPVCMIMGEFEIEQIICDTPENLWKLTASSSGVSSKFFFNYFKNISIGYAIKIKRFISYPSPKLLSDLGKNYKAPQSFRYID